MPIRVSGLVSGLDTESLVKELVSAYSTKKDSYVKKQTKMEWTMDAWSTVNSKTYSFYSSTLSNARFSSDYNVKKASSSNEKVATVSTSNNAVNGTQTLSVKQLAATGYMTGSRIAATDNSKLTGKSTLAEIGMTGDSGKIAVGDTEIELTSDMTMNDFISKLKDAGVNANFDEDSQRIFINAKKSGVAGEFSIVAKDESGLSAITNLGLFSSVDTQGNETADMKEYRKLAAEGDSFAADVISRVEGGTLANSAGSARISAQDAKIVLNGAEFTGSNNSFSINGLNINISAVTETKDEDGNVISDDPIQITTSTDTQGIYDKIKSFLKGYNELVSYLDGLYYADAASGYEPLTDDEKEKLTDKQIEDWEKKVKDGLLHRDSNLSAVSYALRGAFSKTTLTVGDKTYSISDFGIGTGEFAATKDKDRGVYHINGDKDDPLTSSKADKLMEAISKDPEAVTEFFQKLANNMYDALSDKMKSSSVRSAFTIYNDKQMSSQYSDYTDKVKSWEDKLKDYEDYYYKKFSQMEKALSELQQKTSALQGLLGG